MMLDEFNYPYKLPILLIASCRGLAAAANSLPSVSKAAPRPPITVFIEGELVMNLGGVQTVLIK